MKKPSDILLWDLKGSVSEAMPALPVKFRYIVFGFWVAMIGVCAMAVFHIGKNYQLKNQLKTLKEGQASMVQKLSLLKETQAFVKQETRKAKAMVQWLDHQYQAHNILNAIFGEGTGDVRYEKLQIQFTEGQPQVHISASIHGTYEAATQTCTALNHSLTELGFRSVSVNQPWDGGGIRFDGLYIFPNRRARI